MPGAFEESVGLDVVIDTNTSFVFLGRLEAATAGALILAGADAHDAGGGRSGKEVYIMEAKKLGIRKNRERLRVLKSAVVSVSRLSDVTEY